MRTQTVGLLVVSVFLLSEKAVAQGHAYPEAPRVPTVDTYHGVDVSDPYRWMEDLTSPVLRSWIEAQDEFSKAFVKRTLAADPIERRLNALRSHPRVTSPIRRGTRLFFQRREVGEQYGRLYVQEDGDEPRSVVDLGELARTMDGGTVASYSPNGRYLTLSSSVNSSWQQVRIRTLEGHIFPELLTGLYAGAFNTPWRPDGDGFYYVRYPVPDDPQAPLGRGTVFYHRIGTDQSKDVLIFERPAEPELRFGLKISPDGRYLVIAASEAGSFTGMSERLFYQDLQNPADGFEELFTDVEGDFAFEGNVGARFLIRTNVDAPAARLVEVDLNRPGQEFWREVLPGEAGPLRGVSMIGGRLVALRVRDARMVVGVHDYDGGLILELPVTASSFWGAVWTDDIDNPVTYYGINDPVEGQTVFEFNVLTGETEVYFRPDRGLVPEDFVLEQVFYESFDGTRVPMYLAYRRELQRDGESPVFMYGYGFGGWLAFPWQSHLLAWMEMGGIYAVPNIRGGGEYGDGWEAAGARENKPNSIRDFIAAAEFLVRERFTRRGLVVANGGSASGMLPLAVAHARPDLFGAAVANYPIVDMLRFPQFGRARSWIEDFGDPEDPDEFRVLHSYSPYHNVVPGACYPPTWVQVGELDDTTTPMHGYKYVAAVQHAQACDAPILLKIAWGAGHNMGATPNEARRTEAEELAFLVATLGIEVPTHW